jgi:hypothetical protein
MNARRARRLTIALVAVAAACGVACVLVEPPGEPLPPLEHRPLILHMSLAPPEGRILESWPDQLTVPVEMLDPTASFQWHAFIDYDPSDPPNDYGFGRQDPNPLTDDGGVREVYVPLHAPVDLTACHTIEVLVANTFDDPHSPDPLGGDDAVWFYAPSGSLDGCPFYDAGPIDAGPDADGGLDGGTE